jgi:FixJ family two-component response regulator
VHAASSKRVVLVIEDDPDLREIIVSYLTMSGWEVAAGPIDPSSFERVAAVVLDVRSLATPGFRIFGDTRAQRPELPIVVITSFGDAFISKKAEAMGAASVLEKPFSLEDLERALVRVAPQGRAGL